MQPINLPRELVLAGNRIGESSTKRMKWLFSFAGLNLDNLSEGQRSDLAWEIKAFLLPLRTTEVLASLKRDERTIVPSSNAGLLAAQNVLIALTVVEEPVSDETMRRFQDFVKVGVKAAFGHGWDFTYPQRTERLRLGDRGPIRPVGPFRSFPPLKEVFETTSYDLIKGEMDRLGECANPRCRKPFVTEKAGKGRFCSSRCSTYVRIARFRGKELPEEKTARLVS